MTATKCSIDISETWLPIAVYLQPWDAVAQAAPNPAESYVLTADPIYQDRFSFVANEALVGIYRAVCIDGDGVGVGTTYIYIKADDEGPYVNGSYHDCSQSSTLDAGVELKPSVLESLFSDGDIASLISQIQTVFENELDVGEATAVAIATATRDAILNRIVSGNHEAAGSVGALLTASADKAATAIATRDEILNRVIPGNHEVANSVGAKLAAAADANAVRDSILDRVVSGNHAVAGSVGELLSIAANIASNAETIRDAILDRVIEANHEVDGSVADLLSKSSDSATNADATRDAILERVLAGNHDGEGTVGALLQEILNIPRIGAGAFKHTNINNETKTATVEIETPE
ncbi:MAG TPA: hypothetical protein DDW52_11815 [Planctomycetaceae bacterium]|nr:hypothetical protein [Planctomycetaceae bacterium]